MRAEVDYQKIGQRVRQARQALGWTQEDLGNAVGCSNIHISHVESGRTKISLTLLLRFSYAMDTSLDYFLLDTPYARREALLSEELQKKLARCDKHTLLALNRIVDVLLDQQDAYQNEYDGG